MSECKHGVRMTCFCPRCASSRPTPPPPPVRGRYEQLLLKLEAATKRIEELEALVKFWQEQADFSNEVNL